MANIEIQIISRENIKPVILTDHLKPYNLCLLDQLAPTTYVPYIYFYTKNEANFTPTQFSTHLKRSLQQTLTTLYPFSGRVRDNMFIDRFDQGVPFLEASVSCSLSGFFEESETELLNELLPCKPHTRSSDDDGVLPLIGFQVNVFSCGGIAIGFSMSHKIGDGRAASTFLNSLAATSRSESSEIELQDLDFTIASSLFPPRNPCPQKCVDLVKEMLFSEDEYVTRRFLFDSQSIDRLRNRAKGEGETKPSRVQAVSGVLWKCYMAASTASSGSPTPCLLRQAVNMRPRTMPRLPDEALGNLFLLADAVANPEENLELHELVTLMRQSVVKIDHNFLKAIQGEEGLDVVLEGLILLGEKMMKEKIDCFTISSWCNIGVEDMDFGIGVPVWIGSFGKVGPAFFRFAVLIESKRNGGLEAWLNLDEKRMNVLENDPEFLAYASPCLKIGPKPDISSSPLL